jgi:periplasmic protein TonB
MKPSLTGNMAVRVIVGGTAGLLLVVGMFSLLFHLVDVPFDASAMTKAVRIEFSRTRRDTEVQVKRDERIEKEPPPEAPTIPQMSQSNTQVDRSVVRLQPELNLRGNMTGFGMSGGTDTDVLPLVRIPPDYPPRALSRGIEGWVRVQFTITATGSVRDAIVVAADPRDVFNDAALAAISRWRYNPRVVDGTAVERVGVQTEIRFELTE